MPAGIREGFMSKKKKKVSLSTILLVIILLVGLSVMLYPVISNWWNSHTQSRAIAVYQEAVEELSEVDYKKVMNDAKAYNKEVRKLRDPFVDYEEIPDYDNILNVSGNGVMGYISIPQIRVELPIYHGTGEGVLSIAIGHLQGSTLPIGGAGNHSVISAHRGLPSAKLFSDLDQLIVGDTFTITVLKDVYTYEVEEINIVEPNQMDKLICVPGKDLVTLMTCTPYGINSHRLLVRAHRTDNLIDGGKSSVSADAVQIESITVVPFVAVPLLVILIIYWIFSGRIKKRKVRISGRLKTPEETLSKDDKINL